MVFLKLSPRNKEELYNLRHAQARNCVERTFGIFKKRFPILCSRNEYPYSTQVKLVIALGALHNFIRSRNDAREMEWWERYFEKKNKEDLQKGDRMDGVYGVDSAREDDGMKEFRDRLAERMWIDHVNYTC